MCWQAAKEKQTSKILLPLLSTWKKGTNQKWGGRGVTSLILPFLKTFPLIQN